MDFTQNTDSQITQRSFERCAPHMEVNTSSNGLPRGKQHLLWWIVGIMVVVLSGYAALPRVGSRPPGIRSRCADNIRKICVALTNYRLEHGQYPPPFIADAEGKPMHSWRVLLLPYLDETPLFRQYDFSEPWNGPHNRRLVHQIPDVYLCSRKTHDSEQQAAISYLAVCGSGTVWSESTKGSKDADHRILIVEAAQSNVRWTEPDDVSLDGAVRIIRSNLQENGSLLHGGFTNVGFADMTITCLNASLSRDELVHLFIGDGKIAPSEVERDVE